MAIPRFPSTAAIRTVESALVRHGVVIVENLYGESDCAALREALRPLLRQAPCGDNPFDGFKTRRVFDPLARSRALDEVVLHPFVHGVVRAALSWPYQFGMTIASEVLPGERAQALHRDAAVYPLPPDFPQVMVNTVWAIDEFTAANGATLVVPMSHRDDSETTTVAAEMAAGSVLIYAGTILHGAGANHTDVPRVGLIVEHVARWLRPAECHPLAIGPELASRLLPEMQELVGFNQPSAYFGFIAGQSPAAWLAARSDAAVS